MYEKSDAKLASVDTIISVTAALMGICATIIVTLQVVNYLEFRDVKSKVDEINTIKEGLERINKDNEKRFSDASLNFSSSYANMAREEKDDSQAVTYWLMSVKTLWDCYE